MGYIGGGMYHAEPCPLCGETLWNGRCENPDCHYHWHPKEDDEDEERREEALLRQHSDMASLGQGGIRWRGKRKANPSTAKAGKS